MLPLARFLSSVSGSHIYRAQHLRVIGIYELSNLNIFYFDWDFKTSATSQHLVSGPLEIHMRTVPVSHSHTKPFSVAFEPGPNHQKSHSKPRPLVLREIPASIHTLGSCEPQPFKPPKAHLICSLHTHVIGLIHALHLLLHPSLAHLLLNCWNYSPGLCFNVH